MISTWSQTRQGSGAAAFPATVASRPILAASALRALLAAVILVLGGALSDAAAQTFENWYPADITPPAGTRYPCSLTALPADLPGIPAADHRFINHVYSLILRATQAKLVLLKALDDGSAEAAFGDYLRKTSNALNTLRAEPVPAGLDKFRDHVATALRLQMQFFSKALEARRHGQSMAQVFQIGEGRQASQLLQRAFRLMAARYPAWSAATQQSVYHHLCALDLF
jgi:hypothetical protein